MSTPDSDSWCSDFWRRRPRKHPELVRRDIAGDTLLVPVRGELAQLHRLFVLNPVGAFIWEQIDGERSLEDIARGIVEEFEVEPEQAAADLREYVAQLDEGGLLDDGLSNDDEIAADEGAARAGDG